ncbi:MAG TPA: C13 family peptidase [Vicinamibacterales bacterium]|nr:C13 family peptidase [Vicinamibacterales bacterium]
MALGVARPVFAQQTYILVVTGVPGDEEHAKKFDAWAKTFVDAAKKKDNVPESNITVLSGPHAAKADVEKTFADLAAKAKPNDELFVMLIGHGAFDGNVATFNIPGPDLTAADYAKLLAKFASQKVVFVNTAGTSGAFLQPLAGPNRVIITSTKTGREYNEPEFGQFFVAAFGDDAADRDRNGRVSMAEAFEYAKTKVTQDYQQKGLILTEHATLEDGGDGRIASTIFLGTGRGDAALNADLSDPETKKLVDEKDALEKEIAGLQLRRPSMPEAEYSAQLEKLLTDLALKTKAIRDRAAKVK